MKYRVLIADDEPSIRSLISRVCRDLGWETDTAEDGHQALDLMKRSPHQIFVFDIRMPGLSGLDLARRVSQHQETAAILVVTGHPDVETAVRAMKEGVLDYIQKPIEIDRLADLLKQAAKYHEGRMRSLRARREREQMVRNMADENERFRAMLELSHDAIFLLDARSGEIIDCNATACEKLRYTRQEIFMMSVEHILDLPAYSSWAEFMGPIRDTESQVIEGFQRTKDGILVPVEISFSLTYLASGGYITAVARDVTERKRAQRALEEARAAATMEATKLRSMIEGMDEGVLFADKRDIVTEANDWFMDLIRMPREMVIGAKIWDIYGDEITYHFEPIIEQFRKGLRTEKVVSNREFMGREVSMRIQPVFQDSSYQGVIFNMIDISDLVESRRRAEEASRFKSEFLSQMSFEMRTPLDGIVGMTKVLLDTTLNEEQRIYLEMVNDCAASLHSLVSDILKMSKVEERAIDIEPSDFDLRTILEEAIGKVRPEAEKKQVELMYSLEDGLPVLLRGHGDHLSQAVVILLEDALELFEAKDLLLYVSRKGTEGNVVYLIITVSPSPMDGQDVDLQSAQYPGAAIRVSLLRSAVDMLDGSIWAERRDDEVRRLCIAVSNQVQQAATELPPGTV